MTLICHTLLEFHASEINDLTEWKVMKNIIPTYKHKSGAHKRKNKQGQLQLVQSLKKIDAFLTPSDSFMAGATTSQVSPTPDKPDRQDDDCGVFSKPSSTESCDNIVELSAHSAHEKPSNKIPRLDNDANAPTLRQFECNDPDHLDIVMNSAIQQEKFSDSSEDVTPSVSDLFKKTSLVSEEMFWAFHPHQPTNNVPFNTEATYYRKDTQGTKVRRIWVTYTGLSKQAGGRRSSGGCYEVYRRLLCFGTLIIFKQVKNVISTKLLCFSLFSTLINVILPQPCFYGLV